METMAEKQDIAIEDEGVFQSDLRILMDNLSAMVECYQNMATERARRVWLEAFCIEVSMVTLKLKNMRKRWQTFLPFHEVIDVSFGEELKVVQSWLPLLGDEVEDEEELEYEYDRLELGIGYLLDLMGAEIAPFKSGLTSEELKQAVVEVCKKVDKKLKTKSCDNWEELAMNQLELTVQQMGNSPEGVRECCIEAVKALASELRELEEFFSSELKEEHFMILANRLMHRDCQTSIKAGKNEVTKAHNSWPKKWVKERAIAMKESTKMLLLRYAHGEDLKEYIDLEYPELLEDACFGQYLFKARHELTTEDVQLMVKYCTMIEELNKFIDPNRQMKKRRDAAMGRELDNEEKAIVKVLLALADKAEWRGGATADSIKLGVNRMLGVGFHLNQDMQPLSDQLWKLLKVRKNCDAEKSLKVTWLNIVGWCVRQRLISGGSPALCRDFFPKCGPDDYKAIDKGRSDPPVAFQKVEPLLEKFLK